MSGKLLVNSLSGPNETGGIITFPDGPLVYSGAVIQTYSENILDRVTYSAAITGDGTKMTALDAPFTPKYSNSNILVQWVVNGEIAYNTLFVVWQSGAIITTAGYEGYNSVSGNVRWSGYTVGLYDYTGDNDSTPANTFVQYYAPAGSTTARTYSLAVKASGATATTMYLNRTLNSTSGGNYEKGMSSVLVMEIAA